MKCQLCKMQYSENNVDDVIEHEIYHDGVMNGFPLPNNLHPIVEYDGERYYTMDKDSPIDVIEAVKYAATIAYIRCGYDFAPFETDEVIQREDNVRIFLVEKSRKMVGFLVAEKARVRWRTTWEEYDNKSIQEVDEKKEYWSGRFIWIIESERRKGLAVRMVINSLKYLNVNISEFGYSSHFSKMGESLARSMSSQLILTRA